MSTVSLSFYKARQQTSWYDSSTNPTLMGYNNDSYFDQGVVYQMPVSVTPGYVIQKLTFNVGNISSDRSFDNVNVYAVIYSSDPTGGFAGNTAPGNYSWRGSAYTYINGSSGTSNIVIDVNVNITSSRTYYLFLTTDSGSPLDPYMRGSTNISCSLSEIRPETPATSINVSTTLYMDQSFQISWSPYTSGYTYTVRYSFVNHEAQHEIASRTTANSTWCNVSSNAFGSSIPNSTSGSFKIYVISYNSGGTQVGETSADFTLNLPTSNRAPTVLDGWASASYTAVASNCVAGYSDIQVAVNTDLITFNYGATLKQVNINCNSYNGITKTSGTFNCGKAIAGNNIVTVTVYDSRGLGTTYTQTVVAKPYSPPSFNSLSVIRCDSKGNESSSGTYYAVTPSVSYTSYDGNNTLTIKTRWQVFGGSYSSYTNISNNVKSAAQGGGNIATTSSYLIEVVAIDSIGQSSTQTRTLTNTSVAATLNLKSNGLGAAFFGLSSTDKELTVFGRVGVNSPTNLGFAQHNFDGALLLASGDSWGSENGIYKGNGDGIKMGADGFCNIAIKSWYGIGFVDGFGGTGVAAGIDCRLGDLYVRRDARVGSWIYGQRLQLESNSGNGIYRNGGHSSWIGARDQALVRRDGFDNTLGAFWPVTSCKSDTGTWDVGTLGNSYYFSFASDTDYTADNNVTKSIYMTNTGDFVAPGWLTGTGVGIGAGGLVLNDIGASCGTAEPSGGWNGRFYFQYS
uniref:Uncharacterized protein n=1 Tax=Siphoviridae sp. ctsf32 TaxID=2827594 RepID=A0A8S5LNA3_9CAUD|nr:MAG TPA: protein of unknown function DUF859 [Siphoviridae sp. ctsf32]